MTDKNKPFPIQDFLKRITYGKMLRDLENYIEGIIEDNNKLRLKLNTWNKDREIQKLEDEIKDMRKKSVYIMSDKEYEEEGKFRDEHYKSCKSNVSNISYVFKGNGIGSWISVKCLSCGQEKEIADIDNW